jgi:hypothetical protein
MWDLKWTEWRWGRFSPSNSVSPGKSSFHQFLHNHPSPIIRGWYNRPVVAAVPKVPPHKFKNKTKTFQPHYGPGVGVDSALPPSMSRLSRQNMGRSILQVLRFPLPIFIPPISPQSPSTIFRGWYNRPVLAAIPRDSVSPR